MEIYQKGIEHITEEGKRSIGKKATKNQILEPTRTKGKNEEIYRLICIKYKYLRKELDDSEVKRLNKYITVGNFPDEKEILDLMIYCIGGEKEEGNTYTTNYIIKWKTEYYVHMRVQATEIWERLQRKPTEIEELTLEMKDKIVKAKKEKEDYYAKVHREHYIIL